jgi:hypothetical protein
MVGTFVWNISSRILVYINRWRTYRIHFSIHFYPISTAHLKMGFQVTLNEFLFVILYWPIVYMTRYFIQKIISGNNTNKIMDIQNKSYHVGYAIAGIPFSSAPYDGYVKVTRSHNIDSIELELVSLQHATQFETQDAALNFIEEHVDSFHLAVIETVGVDYVETRFTTTMLTRCPIKKTRNFWETPKPLSFEVPKWSDELESRKST